LGSRCDLSVRSATSASKYREMLLTVASLAESSVFTRAILSANPADSAWMASCFDSCQSRSCRVKTASMAGRRADSTAGGSCSCSRTHTCSSLRVCGCSPGSITLSVRIGKPCTECSAITVACNPHLYKWRTVFYTCNNAQNGADGCNAFTHCRHIVAGGLTLPATCDSTSGAARRDHLQRLHL